MKSCLYAAFAILFLSSAFADDRPKVVKRLQELYAQWSSEIASQPLNLKK